MNFGHLDTPFHVIHFHIFFFQFVTKLLDLLTKLDLKVRGWGLCICFSQLWFRLLLKFWNLTILEQTFVFDEFLFTEGKLGLEPHILLTKSIQLHLAGLQILMQFVFVQVGAVSITFDADCWIAKIDYNCHLWHFTYFTNRLICMYVLAVVVRSSFNS